jgi:hypothetical protein
MAHVVDIYLQPAAVFADLKERPAFLLPFALVAVASVAMMLLYFLTVDPAWYLDHALLASGNEMTAGEMAQAKKIMPGARTLAWITSIVAVLGMAAITVLYGVYFWLAGRVTGTGTTFRQGLALSTWANMPILLGLAASLAAVATMPPQTSLESLMLLNADPLLVQLPADDRWSSLAKNFNLLTLWALFLTALGWRAWGRTGWLQAGIVATLPTVVIYGGMALYALAR